MSNILKSYEIAAKPLKGTHRDASHLRNGTEVAITEEGLKAYNSRRRMKRLGIGATLGLFALPLSIGGGIGLAMGGEAIGIGLLEQAAFGAIAGAGTANATSRKVSGYLRDDKHKTLTFVDMVGTVVSIQQAWFSENKNAKDVQVKWVAADEFGNRTTFTAWHDPSQLFAVKKAA